MVAVGRSIRIQLSPVTGTSQTVQCSAAQDVNAMRCAVGASRCSLSLGCVRFGGWIRGRVEVDESLPAAEVSYCRSGERRKRQTVTVSNTEAGWRGQGTAVKKKEER